MKNNPLPLKENCEKMITPLKDLTVNVALIALGCIVFMIGLTGVLVPQGFLTGGLTGLALIAHYQYPFLGIGFVYLCLNLPLAYLGWKHVSRRFMLYSLFGMGFFSWSATFVHYSLPPVRDPMLAALLAGVICGSGAGLILRSAGSAGGLDILAVYMNKKFGFRIGAVIFFFNAAVLLAGVFFYNLEIALYSLVYLFTSGKITDAVLTGFNKRKMILVVSNRAEEIAHRILESRGRGVTFLKGEGAFTRTDKKIIFTITSLMELPKMKELILAEDPGAFIVVNDTLEVLGTRHGMGRVY